MKKEVVMYKNGSIVDYAGIEHKFIVCALSTSVYGRKDTESAILVTTDEEGDVAETILPRAVFIGVSVCNPGDGKDKLGDNWSEEKGKMIAYNKAKGFKVEKPEKSAAIFATRAGLISEGLVQALLDREVAHIEEDPQYVIPGYNAMAKKYKEEQELKAYINGIPSDLKELGQKLAGLDHKEIEQVFTVAANG